jgi:ABC-type multidrug transport system ATPase subunit
MPDGQSLEFSGVTKRFGAVTAVSDLSARVEPGRVTGFLGPNGAGKTTTLRILLGLVRATGGQATIGGRRYADLDKPLQTVGAVLEASSFHPGRTGAAHLTIYAQAAGIPKGRVDEVLGLVGLADAGGRKVGGYSLGMRQRLGLAYALLGDPGVLVLDEPANGLDPEGIRWMRGFLRRLAAEGRTVLVSSHLLAEVQQTVDALLIISRGRLVFEGSIDDLADPSEFATVVDAPDRAALTAALSAAGLPYEVLRSGLTVRGADPATVGAAAAAAGVALSGLQRRGPALEEVFLDLVNGTRVHPSAPGAGPLSPVGEGTAVTAAPDAPAPVAAGVVRAAAGGEAPGQDESVDDDARTADESALASAELDAEATGAPGAAAALGTAAGGAWAAERADGVRPRPETEGAETVPVAPPDAEPRAEAVPAAEAQPAPAAQAESAADANVESEPRPRPPAQEVTTGAGFAVASTGVIDIVPPAASEPEPELRTSSESASEPPEDADPDVEALGDIDDELSSPEPPDEDDDRPWEYYVKTEADVEADAFFAAFDTAAADQGQADRGDPDDAARLADARSASGADGSPEDDDTGTTETASHEPSEDEAPEAWVPPEAQGTEAARDAASGPSEHRGEASAPSPGDPGDRADRDGSDDHEGGER